MAEPKLQKFFGSFQTTLIELTQSLENFIGLRIDELFSLPQGEFAIAVVPTTSEPRVCLLMDVGDELPGLEILLAKIEERQLAREGRVRNKKRIGEIEVISNTGGGRPDFGYFISSSVFVFSTSVDYTEKLANIWNGADSKHVSLADNIQFTSLLSRCVGTQGERPQVSFFANPVGIFRDSIRSSPNAIMTLATIKTLGLDGIKAVGGSLILAANEFDSVLHVDVAMDHPRPGVLGMLRPKTGSTEPEPWVSENVVAYATANWDVRATISAIRQITDSFSGEGTLDSMFKQMSTSVGVDFKKDILDQLTGRFSMASVVLPERVVNGQANIISFQVRDSDAVGARVLPKLFQHVQKSESRWKKKVTEGVDVYYLELDRQRGEFVRAVTPSFCLVRNTVLMSDSLKALEGVLEVNRSQEALLADAIEFRLIHDKIKAQMQGKEFSIMTYNRPDEQLRLFYEMANDPAVRDKLEESATNNPFLQALVKALREGDLPPFDEIAKFIAPTGAFVTEEMEGLHYTAFTLKRN